MSNGCFNDDLLYTGYGENPAPMYLAGYGYDPEIYIASANLAPSAYVTQSLIAAKIGMPNLISGCDDSQPPIGNLNPTLPGGVIPNPAYLTYQAIIQTVVTEINGYLSSVYPIPLAQTGTVAVFQVQAVSTDGLNSVTQISVVQSGNYQTDPANPNNVNLAAGNYSAQGALVINVQNGAVYSYNKGANETGAFLNGTTTLNGNQTFVAAASTITIYGTANAATTANFFLVAPNTAYLVYLDPIANSQLLGANAIGAQGQPYNAYPYPSPYPRLQPPPGVQTTQQGLGLQLQCNFQAVNYSDESGQVLQAKSVFGLPTILNGGINYQVGELIVLVGGSSFVPAKVRQAALDLICHTLYKRRLSPDEKNPFSGMAKMWRDLFKEIGEGNAQLDGTYKRFYSAVTAWTQRSVVAGANSL